MVSQNNMEKVLSEFKSIDVTGFLTPFRDGQPCLVQMPNNPNFWVAVFSEKDKLEQACEELGIYDYVIKQVTDGKDFVQSIVENGIRIMLNPYTVKEENKTRWTEVIWSSP